MKPGFDFAYLGDVIILVTYKWHKRSGEAKSYDIERHTQCVCPYSEPDKIANWARAWRVIMLRKGFEHKSPGDPSGMSGAGYSPTAGWE